MKGPEELEAVIPSSEFQAVLVYVDQVDFGQSLPLEDALVEVMEPSDIGYHDGNEIGGGETILWLFGTDAEKVFKLIEPTLRRHPFCNGARIVLRYGEYGSPEREFDL